MKLLILAFLGAFSLVHASDAPMCRSQLLRVDIARDSLTGVSGKSALLILRRVAPQLQGLLEQDYRIDPFPFPVNKEECQLQGVNCPDNFCQNPSVDPVLKGQVCFSLPCPLFEGSKHVGKCSGVQYLYGHSIGFPEPVSIKKLALDVKSVDSLGKEARLCFRVNELELSLAAELTFDTNGTRLPDRSVTVRNIEGQLDQPKDVCISAELDIASSTPVKKVKILPVGRDPFISDDVIRKASQRVILSGLSGYSQRELERAVPELLPVLIRPLRQTIEKSVADALGKVLEEVVEDQVARLASEDALLLDSSLFMSELSFTGKRLWDSVYFNECRQLVFSGKQVPVGHPCIGLDVTFFDRLRAGGDPNEKISLASGLKFFLEGSTMTYELSYPDQWPNVVSENFRKRLLVLRQIVEKSELSSALTAEQIKKIARERQGLVITIDKFVAQIEKKRAADKVFQNVEIQGDLFQGVRREVGLALPDVCSQTRPSAHAQVSIPNCPIQAYVDLNEFNYLLRKLWETGRICDGGKGAYKPNSSEFPNGCRLPTDLISCRLEEAPQLTYQGKSGRYATSIKLRNCRKNILPFGIFGASLGGDFNVSLTFKPKACNNGDFCIDQPRVTWNLVSGSQEGLLKDPLIRGQITRAIDSSINEAMSKTFRIPLASATSGLIAEIPLKSEGRTKSGAGYFGVCLKEDR